MAGMTREFLNYDGLLAGEVYTVDTVNLAGSQTVVRGDLLECVVTEGAPATTFAKVTAPAKVGNIYRIAAEDATTSAETPIVAYGAGYYNKAKVNVNGDETTNVNVLKASGIILKDVQDGTIK